MKNVALAWQMYLTDFDKFPPIEHRAEVVNWFQEIGDGGCVMVGKGSDATFNPFLRIPVILDEYIKNRDVWACPSGRIQRYSPHRCDHAGLVDSLPRLRHECRRWLFRLHLSRIIPARLGWGVLPRNPIRALLGGFLPR